MNQSCLLQLDRLTKPRLVIVDTRHTLYDFRQKFRNHVGSLEEWIEKQVLYNAMLTHFITLLQSRVSNYVFLFFHKNKEKNQALHAKFLDYCHKNSINIDPSHIVCAHKNSIGDTVFNIIREYKTAQRTINSHGGTRHVRVYSESGYSRQETAIVTHNPISLQFAKLMTLLTKQQSLQFSKIALYLFSSYFHQASKKQLIEEHFYKYNFQVNPHSLTNFYHISSLCQMIEDSQPLMEKPGKRIVVGYYFYPKKTNELIQNKVLSNSAISQLVPIDFRYINKAQYAYFNILFQKILDLNKTKEIKFTKEEVQTMRTNYEVIKDQFNGLIIDPIHTIPIIAERVKFQEVFSKIINCQEFQTLQKERGEGIKFQTPIQIEFLNSGNYLNGFFHENKFDFPVIVKSKAAAFTSNCHTMSIAVSVDGFTQLLKHKDFKGELLVQEIIDHSSLIYKVYCLGSHVIIQKRKSIPYVEPSNFTLEEGFTVFDSQKDVYSQVSKCLKVVRDNDLLNQDLPHEPALTLLIHKLQQLISQAFEITLFGFDIIGNLSKKQFYIIDINHFPGYKNVPKLKEHFDQLFLDKLSKF